MSLSHFLFFTAFLKLEILFYSAVAQATSSLNIYNYVITNLQERGKVLIGMR